MLRYKLAAPLLWAHRLVAPLRTGARRDPAFRILLLHDIPRESFRAFERLVLYIKDRHGFISPEQAQDWLDGRPPILAGGNGRRRVPFLLTFDDGFSSNFEAARWMLDRHHIKALFFVCPGLMDLDRDAQRAAIAGNIYDGRVGPEALPDDMRLMTWDEVTEVRDLGHSIGAHGMTHRRLSTLSGEALRAEIVTSGDVLEQRLGCDIPWYAFAFGNIESISGEAQSIIESRFKYSRSGIRGPNRRTTSPYGVLADQVDLHAPQAYQSLLLEGGLDLHYGAARDRLKGLC